MVWPDTMQHRIGDYQIIRNLGSGGMGTVYLAMHVSQRYQVALKVLSPQLSRDQKALRRFQREAQALLALDHPHIVKVYEVGSSGGVYYIAMQYILGSPLTDMLKPGRPVDLRKTLDLIQQVASALDFAHARGFVHRDVKPGNILLAANDHAVLTDFGLAKSLFQSQLTSSGTTLGTPAYVSPEQARGRGLDRRTDIYSLAVVCYQMLTGQVPFQKEEVVATLLAHVTEAPPPLRRLNPALPEPVEQVVLRGLAKAPGQRFDTAGQFAQALRAAAAGTFPSTVQRRPIGLPMRRAALQGPLAWGMLAIGAVAVLVVLMSRIGSDQNGPAPTSSLLHPQMALESDRDGNREIYIADRHGASQQRLTWHQATDWAPAWSPDGQEIAFVSERDGNMEIYVMDAAGQGLTCLTRHSSWDSGPSWSPSGNLLAFDSDRDGDFEIYVMGSDGSGVRQLTDNPALDGDPAWSPMGDQIASVSDRDGNHEIYVMDSQGGSLTRLTQNTWRDLSPAWSADGRKIAFECQRESGMEICVMDSDGSGLTRLTFNSEEEGQPCWVGGGEIVFCRRQGDVGPWQVWVMSGDGSNQRVLIGGSGSNTNPMWRN